ncbi:DUF799 domain-containing protein [Pseudorhodoferax sp.]|uniref:DUF799 domain-containing protein n=1 Tax=Pseudorhodoferax sp. TaxID=1993553 RepID=UPI0039E5B9AA
MRARLAALAATAGLALLSGCAVHQRAPYDYSAFLQARPASLLVLPPLNDSPEVGAAAAVWAQATLPLAEAGYYVLPAALVDETFRQNGVHGGYEAQGIPFTKLREFFGADAAVYLKVTEYGTSYQLLASDTRVTVEGRIVDLRDGRQLWAGKASASSAEQQQSQGGGLVGALVTALIRQIVDTSTDAAYGYAGIASQRLLGAPRADGILPGPRSPQAGQVPGQR